MRHNFYQRGWNQDKKVGGGSRRLNGAAMANYWVEQDQGRATDREWRHPGLFPSREKPTDNKPRNGRCEGSDDHSGRTRRGHRLDGATP